MTLFADMKDNDFDVPFLWFLDSLQSKEVNRVLFHDYINLDTNSFHALHAVDGSLRTDGVFEASQSWAQLSGAFDIYHPYWKHRKIFFRTRAGISAFCSTCQFHVDSGFHSADHCIGQSQRDSSLASHAEHSVIHVITKNILPKMREQHEQLTKMATQQRAFEQLLEAFHELNATVALLANQRGACSNTASPTTAHGTADQGQVPAE